MNQFGVEQDQFGTVPEFQTVPTNLPDCSRPMCKRAVITRTNFTLVHVTHHADRGTTSVANEAKYVHIIMYKTAFCTRPNIIIYLHLNIHVHVNIHLHVHV